MKLSVVMPVFNAAPFVGRAVESVISQLPVDAELICIDDGSRDSSWTSLNAFSDRRLKLVQQENQGAAAARNKGLDLAQGDFIAFLDADDLALPGRFDGPLALLEKNQALSIVGGCCLVIGPLGDTLREESGQATDTWLRWITLFNSPFTFSTVTVRKSDLRFDPAVVPAEDYAYCADQMDRGKGVILPGALAGYRLHAGQVTKLRNDLLRDSGNAISQRKIKERLGVDLPLDLVFLMRHVLAFGWQRLGPEHHVLALEAQKTLLHLFSLFKRGKGLKAVELAKIEAGLLSL